MSEGVDDGVQGLRRPHDLSDLRLVGVVVTADVDGVALRAGQLRDDRGLGIRQLLREDAVDDLIARARTIMEAAPEPSVRLSVPLVVDAGQGMNWAEAH